MATQQKFLYADNSTLANFQAWAGALSAAFAAFGWVKTSDTGQTAPGSASAVPAANAYIYEIWAMNDSLSSSNPVYLKVQYGSGPTATWPALLITAGSGSNGSGTLTNPGTTLNVGPSSTGGTTTSYECDFSGTAGRIQFCLWRGYTYPCIYSIERSHNSSGSDTGSYVTAIVGSYGASTPYVYQQTLTPAANGGALFVEQYGTTLQSRNTTTVYANSAAAVPFFPIVGLVDNPMMGLLCIKSGDFSDGAQFQVTSYGASHNYLVTKASVCQWGNQTNNSVAIRYE